MLVHGFAATSAQVWEQTGWVKRLNTAGFSTVLVDLPFHEVKYQRPHALTYSNHYDVRIPLEYGELLEVTERGMVELIQQLGYPVHLVGFSAGARICWGVAARFPESVDSLCVGGLPQENHLPLLAEMLKAHKGVPLSATEQMFTRLLADSPVQKSALHSFVAHSGDLRFDPMALRPLCPTLVVQGEADSVSGSSQWLIDGLQDAGTPHKLLLLPQRDHVNALTSGVFKKAVISWIQQAEANTLD